jgi:uncharacterized membrane protein YecN with MAPEG domain
MGMRLGTLLGMGSKETWALISIMVYAFVIHARFLFQRKMSFQFNGMFCFYFDFVHPVQVNFHSEDYS